MKKSIWFNQIGLFQKLLFEKYTFFTGVPDSSLRVFIEEVNKFNLINVVATHESQAIGIAVGAEMAGKKSCVYLQNSGIGNVVNPISSLCLPFKIFPLLIIGHRHTIPQHEVMGRTDEKILDLLEYKNYILVKKDNDVK